MVTLRIISTPPNQVISTNRAQWHCCIGLSCGKFLAKSAWRSLALFSYAVRILPGVSRRLVMNLQFLNAPSGQARPVEQIRTDPGFERNWYAVFTIPQNEKSTARHLTLRSIETFLPTYETLRVWKNRQRMKIVLPLFPSYLFVHIDHSERVRVLQSPGVLHIVGSGRNYAPLDDAEVEFLRSGLSGRKIEPYRELVVGEKVRIKTGVMQGLVGTLVRRSSSLRFVLTLDLINQHAAVEVDADTLECAPA